MGLEERYGDNRLSLYLMISLGAALFGLAIALFMVPYHVAPGGISGIAIIINHATGWPTGLLMALLEIPIFFLGLRYLGVNFSVKVIYATFCASLCTFLFSDVMHLRMELAPGDVLLAPIFGAVVMGAGLGLIIKAGAATSGSGTIARIVNHYSNYSISAAIGVINGSVILLAWVVFRESEAAMYGLVALYLSSKVIDIIVEGMSYARAAIIISPKSERIVDEILHVMDRGVTTWQGTGAFSGVQRDVIYCVVERKELSNLIRLVKHIDHRAFITISEVYEVLGEGFKRRI